MFLDALFRAGTGDAIEVGVELLKNKKIAQPYADLYYLQFGSAKHATLPSLTAAVVSEKLIPFAVILLQQVMLYIFHVYYLIIASQNIIIIRLGSRSYVCCSCMPSILWSSCASPSPTLGSCNLFSVPVDFDSSYMFLS